MKLKDLKQLIFEAYIEVLREEGAVLPTKMDTILQTYPDLVKTLESLFNKNFKDVVIDIQNPVPVPTEFNVTLVSRQNFFLKWMGKHSIKPGSISAPEDNGWFQAKIAGKKYNLNNEGEFQQALDSLGELLKTAPIGGQEPVEGVDTGTEENPFGGEPEAGAADSGFGGETPEPAGGETEFEEEPTT
jgi:hypothetical protein